MKTPNRIPPKPPLGLCNKKTFLELRNRDILQAVARYKMAGKTAPLEWSKEYQENRKTLAGMK